MRRVLEYLSFCFFAVALMTFNEPIVFGVLEGIYGDMGHVPPALLGRLMFVSPLFPLVLGFVAFARLKVARVNVSALIGFRRATIGSDAALGLIIGIAGLAVALASLFVLARVMTVPPFASLPVSAHLYFATVGAVVPGVCEELFFRGLLFKLADRARPWLAVVAGAIAFSAWHLATPIYLFHTFVLGLLLGAAVVKRGRLAPAIIGHSLANALFGAWLLAGLPIPSAAG